MAFTLHSDPFSKKIAPPVCVFKAVNFDAPFIKNKFPKILPVAVAAKAMLFPAESIKLDCTVTFKVQPALTNKSSEFVASPLIVIVAEVPAVVLSMVKLAPFLKMS